MPLVDEPAARPAREGLPATARIGRYALRYHIGSGGLGKVYAAHDPLLSRLIAIKTLKVEAAEREAFEAAFVGEARAAARLSHPNIVTVFDAGISDEGPYIAMELLKGRDLQQLRESGWRPRASQAAAIVCRVAEALGYAHSKGVVHRDVKPANIFMVGHLQPRVLDFGIASVAQRGAKEASAADGSIAGSPFYMAPEQIRGEAVDRRADVFALGVVFYELLCGQRPFRGRTLAEIQHAVLHEEPPPPHKLDRSVPSALSAIAARAIEKDPERRYRSARRMARDLRQWLQDHVHQDEAADLETAAMPKVTAPQPRVAPWRRHARWLAIAAAALGIATAGWWLGRLSATGDAATGNGATVPAVPAALR